MRRAYYGCLSYTDDLIGQALTALDEGGATEHTVVSLIGNMCFYINIDNSIILLHTRYTPIKHLYCHMYTYMHPLYMYIQPYIHLTHL